MKNEVVTLKVSTNSNSNSVAGAIANIIKEAKTVEINTIGAGALNQAVKAIAIARGYVAPVGIDLICIPAFVEIQINEEDKTGIKLIIKGE